MRDWDTESHEILLHARPDIQPRPTNTVTTPIPSRGRKQVWRCSHAYFTDEGTEARLWVPLCNIRGCSHVPGLPCHPAKAVFPLVTLDSPGSS